MTKATPQNEDALTLVRRMYRAWRDGDLSALRDAFSPDAVINCHGLDKTFFPFVGEWRGYYGLDQFRREVDAVFEARIHENEAVCTAGNWVVVVNTVKARHRPTGKKVTTVSPHVFRVEDGCIVELHQHMETLELRRFLEG